MTWPIRGDLIVEGNLNIDGDLGTGASLLRSQTVLQSNQTSIASTSTEITEFQGLTPPGTPDGNFIYRLFLQLKVEMDAIVGTGFPYRVEVFLGPNGDDTDTKIMRVNNHMKVNGSDAIQNDIVSIPALQFVPDEGDLITVAAQTDDDAGDRIDVIAGVSWLELELIPGQTPFDPLVGVAPVPGEFGFAWIEGSQAATNTDFQTSDLYDGGGASVAGVHLDDNVVDFSYLTFICAHGTVAADNTGEGLIDIRDDKGAATGTTPSVKSATTGAEMRTSDQGGPDANYHWLMARSAVSNAGRESEWGVWFVEGEDIAGYTMDGACVVVIPALNTPLNTTAQYAGPHLFAEKTHRVGAGILDPVGITAADTDNISAGADTVIAETGDYLIFTSCRIEGVNNSFDNGISSIRWTITDDGTDIFGVKTNTATSGAVRTGRGFQHNTHMLAGANKIRFNVSPFVVRNLTAATHNWRLVGNHHESAVDGTDRILQDGIIAMKTEQFDPFVSLEDTTALLVDFDTMTDWNEGVTVTGDGVKQFWVGFSTTLHTETAGTGLEFQFTANDVRIDTVSHARHNPYGTGDGQTGVADSDNCCLPVHYWFVHTPAAEETTYKVQVRRAGGGNSPIMNSNDNGEDGFKGTIFAAGISFRLGS